MYMRVGRVCKVNWTLGFAATFCQNNLQPLGQQHKEAVIIDACLLFNSDLIFGRIQVICMLCRSEHMVWLCSRMYIRIFYQPPVLLVHAVVGLKVSKLAEKELTCQCFGHILE